MNLIELLKFDFGWWRIRESLRRGRYDYNLMSLSTQDYLFIMSPFYHVFLQPFMFYSMFGGNWVQYTGCIIGFFFVFGSLWCSCLSLFFQLPFITRKCLTLMFRDLEKMLFLSFVFDLLSYACVIDQAELCLLESWEKPLWRASFGALVLNSIWRLVSWCSKAPLDQTFKWL